MSRSKKATVVGNVICTQKGKPLVQLQGKSGNILSYAHNNEIAVMLIDGLRYHIPVEMVKINPSQKGGADCG